MADYLSMLDQAPDVKQSVIEIGKQALASGKISPAEAKANAAKMGVKGLPDDDFLNQLISGGQQQSPYDFSGPGGGRAPASAPMSEGPATPPSAATAPQAPTPQAPAPAVPSSPYQRKGRKDTNSQTSHTTQNTLYTEPEITDAANAVNSTPQFQAANKALQEQEDQLNMLKNAPHGQEAPWLRPFLGLVDAQTGTSYQKNYQPGGMSPQERQKILLQYGNDLTQRKSEMAKALLEGIGKLKSGSQQTGTGNVTINTAGDLGTGKGMSPDDAQVNKLQTLVETARGSQAAQQAEKDLYAASKVDTLANMYGDPNKLSSQQVKTLVSEVGKIASGGVPTQHELEGMQPGTWTGKMAEAWSKLQNNPEPAQAAAFIKQYTDYAHGVGEDAKKLITDRYGRILNPWQDRLSGHSVYQNLRKETVDRFKDKAQSPGLSREDLIKQIEAKKAAQAGGQ